jgi:hypothetical protein
MNKYKKAIEKKIQKMEKQIEQNYFNQYAKKIGVKAIIVERKDDRFEDQRYNITIDDYELIGVRLDHYNNLSVDKFLGVIPIDYLEKFREFFNEVLEYEDSYDHRAGGAFLIYYLRKFYEIITPDFLEEMCKLDDIDGEKNSTFRQWVYSSSCNYYISKKFGIERR